MFLSIVTTNGSLHREVHLNESPTTGSGECFEVEVKTPPATHRLGGVNTHGALGKGSRSCELKVFVPEWGTALCALLNGVSFDLPPGVDAHLAKELLSLRPEQYSYPKFCSADGLEAEIESLEKKPGTKVNKERLSDLRAAMDLWQKKYKEDCKVRMGAWVQLVIDRTINLS